jgi:hypothetical protein
MSVSLKLLRLSLAVSILAIASIAAAANNSEQVVFSGTGLGTFTPPGGQATDTPFGFWIWCESDSRNPYLGECHGAMYFYQIGIVRSVQDTGAGAITELSDGIYQISVASSDGAVACTLTNESDNHGPSNVVDVSCSAPAGSGQAPKSVVNVTGP